MAVACAALAVIRRHELDAIPANYALCYAYAAGTHPRLSRALDDLLAVRGKLHQCDLEDLARAHIPSDAEVLDRVSTGIETQIAGVVQAIASAIDSTLALGGSLDVALRALTGTTDARSIAALVRGIVESTARARHDSRQLGARLDDSAREIGALRAEVEMLRSESMQDPLTGLYNRRSFEREIRNLVDRAQNGSYPLSLLMIDIDHFKSFNDNFGHQTGDQVIKLVAHVLGGHIGSNDVAARYGGEEFVLVLPATRLEDAIKVAEEIRCAVTSNKLRKRSTGALLGNISVSIGVAELACSERSDALIERADSCLYEAKRAGRNRVVHGRVGMDVASSAFSG